MLKKCYEVLLCASVSKGGDEDEDNRDAFALHDYGLAVSDGTTGNFLSGDFAWPLVNAYRGYLDSGSACAATDPCCWQADALRTASAAWERALECEAKSRTGWALTRMEEKLRRGDCGAATFVGVEFVERDAAGSMDVRFFQIGDSVLFHVYACRRAGMTERLPDLRWWQGAEAPPSVRIRDRSSGLQDSASEGDAIVAYRVLPEMEWQDFNNSPQCLRARGDNPMLTARLDTVQPGDLLILATDALAIWMLRQPQLTDAVASLLTCSAVRGDWTDSFSTWVADRRSDSENALELDDTTAIVVRME